MFNLLNSEFYKLKKSKSFLICCVMLIIFIALMYGMLILADKISKGEADNGSFGVVVSGEVTEGNSVLDNISILEVEQQIFNLCVSIFTSIFACIFIIGEYKNGAMKNIVGKGYTRKKIFLAKYIATISITAFMIMMTALVNLLCGIIVLGTDELSKEFFKNLCIYTGIETLLGAALIGVVIAISEISRGIAVGISISLGLTMFSGLISKGFDLLLYKWDIKVSDYWIMDLIDSFPVSDFDSSLVIRAVVSGILWMIAALLVGTIHFQKTDIK